MNQKMMTAALRLAIEFRHEWPGPLMEKFEMTSGQVPEDLVSWPPDVPLPAVEEIHRITLAARGQDAQAGISHPSFHEGSYVHTTASGRLSWFINADGNVRIEIDRPDHPTILFIEVKVSGNWFVPAAQGQNPRAWEAGDVQIYLNEPDQVYARHLSAAKKAIVALIGQEGADTVFSPQLMAQEDSHV